MGAVNKVGDGRQTKCWLDVWLDGVPLRISCHELFQVSRDPEAMVADLVEGDEWLIQFRKRLDGDQMEKWREMEGRLQDVRLSGEEDEIRRALEKSGCFSSRSLYHFLSSGEVRSRRMEKI
jgi:hypothetical protein